MFFFLIYDLTINIRTFVFSDNLEKYSTKQNIKEDKRVIKSISQTYDISYFAVIRTKGEVRKIWENCPLLIHLLNSLPF